jgi:hypothetical protein
MVAGLQIPLLNTKSIMVPQSAIEDARAVIEDYVAAGQTADDDLAPARRRRSWSLGDRLRMVLELLLFGWCMPGARWPRREEKAL